MPNFKKSNKGYMMKPKGMGQQGYAMMGGGKSVKPPKPYSGSAKYQGEIKKAPSKATQFIRKVKSTRAGTPGLIGFSKSLVKGAIALSPIGILGKSKAVSQITKAFSNAPKQYMRGASKNVPVVGKPGTTVKVPKSSKTKQVSYVNPRISMTAAERLKAGY